MKRDDIFKNVAFGGGWSERIVGVERYIEALQTLNLAISQTEDHDLREDSNMIAALKLCTKRIPRGPMLHDAWLKTLTNPTPHSRHKELQRLYQLIENGLGTNVML